MQIKQQLVTSRKKTGSGKNPAIGIIIHETANLKKGAGAQAHANLQTAGNVRQASWHYSVDDKLVIQSFPHDVQCWHAGTSTGNNNYIGIEICVNEDSDYVQACKNAAELVRHLRANGVGSKLAQHNGFSGKDCPNFMREGRDGVTWAEFSRWVAGGVALPAPTPPAPAPTPEPAQRLKVDGVWGGETTSWGQKILGTEVDRVISSQWKNVSNEHIVAAQFDRSKKGSQYAHAIQRRLMALGMYNGDADGLIGALNVYGLQTFYGTPRDVGIARVSPDSAMVRAMQTEINAGSFLGIRG